MNFLYSSQERFLQIMNKILKVNNINNNRPSTYKNVQLITEKSYLFSSYFGEFRHIFGNSVKLNGISAYFRY